MTQLLLPATVPRNTRALRSLTVACERLRGRLPAPPKPLTVIMPVSAAASISHTNVRVLAFKDVSLWHPGMAA